MDKVPGVNLGSIFTSLDEEQLQQVRDQVRSIFNQLGEAGIFHGDAGGLDNYMVNVNGRSVDVCIVDFVEGGVDKSGKLAKEDAAIIDKILVQRMDVM